MLPANASGKRRDYEHDSFVFVLRLRKHFSATMEDIGKGAGRPQFRHPTRDPSLRPRSEMPLQHKLLSAFEAVFAGQPYIHRNATLGNKILEYFYEDLFDSGLSPVFNARVAMPAPTRSLNLSDVRPGVSARRGDGTFGRRLPTAAPALGETPLLALPRAVPTACTANVEIGTESKIMAKAMKKAQGRVVSDLRDQAREFASRCERQPITLAFVGANWAEEYQSFEGDRLWMTTGRGSYKHPIQEADEARQFVAAGVAGYYDEVLFLDFIATNADPYPFAWKNRAATTRNYEAALVRIAEMYEQRFAG